MALEKRSKGSGLSVLLPGAAKFPDPHLFEARNPANLAFAKYCDALYCIKR
jgi:hypothetical protein